MFQTWDNSRLLRRVLWSYCTIVSSLKHKDTQPLYIFNRIRVLHLDRLKEGIWLHSFEMCNRFFETDVIIRGDNKNAISKIIWPHGFCAVYLLWSRLLKQASCHYFCVQKFLADTSFSCPGVRSASCLFFAQFLWI